MEKRRINRINRFFSFVFFHLLFSSSCSSEHSSLGTMVVLWGILIREFYIKSTKPVLEVSWVHNLFLSLVFFQDIAARCSYNPRACGKKRERSLIRALLSRNAAIIGKLKSNYRQFARFSGLSYYFVRASYTRRIVFSNEKAGTVTNKRKFHFAFRFASRLFIRKTWIISGRAFFWIPNFDSRYFRDYRVSRCHSIRTR